MTNKTIDIRPSHTFLRAIKRLAKKYHSILSDVRGLEKELREDSCIGVDLGNGLRKIRMKITDKGRGKSGGARVITHTAIISLENARITLLTIYDKSEMENISDKELLELLKENYPQ